MGKTSKWIKSFLTGKKEKEKEKENANQASPLPIENPSTPIAIPTPKEKRRWSFRRSPAAAANDPNSLDPIASAPIRVMSETEKEQMKHAMAVVTATAAAADVAVAAAQAAVTALRLTTATTGIPDDVEERAAIKIQAAFRSYLAKKALCALKGLVKLQALVRGHLVRRQATATLRCMQALLAVQARARAQRIQMSDEEYLISQRQSIHRKSPQKNRFRRSYEMDRSVEENIKIVEMDFGETRGSSKSRNSYSNPQTERADHRIPTHYAAYHAHSKLENQLNMSPAPLALTDMSPRVCSGHFEDYSFTTAQSSPQYSSAVSKPDPTRTPFSLPQAEYSDPMSHDYPFFPNYMANTESSRAKVRSQSAPKQRPESYERPPSRRRASMEGRNIPRGVRMQRSSSNVASTANGYYQYPWSIKLDRSAVSLKESECGSSSSVLTNNNCCRSLVAYEAHGNRR